MPWTHIGIPQSVFGAYFDRPFSVLASLIGTDGIVNARAHDYECWQQRPKELDGEAYAWGTPFGTFQRMKGYALMREGGSDFRRPDVAALWFQGFSSNDGEA